MRTYALVLLLLSLTVETSYSEPLPKGAVPLTASETRALFAGKTWRYGPDACNENDTGRVTFFADGRTRGIADCTTEKRGDVRLTFVQERRSMALTPTAKTEDLVGTTTLGLDREKWEI